MQTSTHSSRENGQAARPTHDDARDTALALPDIPPLNAPGTTLVAHIVKAVVVLVVGIVGVGLLVGSLTTVDLTIEAFGDVWPETMSVVRTPEGGVIDAVFVAHRDTVREGQVLAALDSSDLKAELRELAAQRNALRSSLQNVALTRTFDAQRLQVTVQSAQTEVLEARASLREQLTNYGLPTSNLDSLLANHRPGRHIDVDRAVARVQRAQRTVETAKVDLEALRRNRYVVDEQQAQIDRLTARIDRLTERLDEQTLHAPSDGVVITPDLSLLVGKRVQSGAPILELASSDRWLAYLQVDGNDVHDVSVGDSARVKVPALKDLEAYWVPGHVVSIGVQPVGRPLGSTDRATSAQGGGSTAYRATVALDVDAVASITSDQLRIGYGVEGHIVTDTGPPLYLAYRYLRGLLR